jgi:DivIVA domain-containing protein
MNKKDAAMDVGSEWSAAPAGRMTPADVQEKEFHVTRVGAGYRMREVDEFLDQVTDTLSALIAENDRLQATATPEQAAGLPMGRPKAADPEDRGAVQAFLHREKGFLQDLGGLVQAHAEELRSMAREVRRDAAEPAVTSMAPAADPVEIAPPLVEAEGPSAQAAVEPMPVPSGTIEPPPEHEPENHEPENHEPENHEPENHEPENHEQENEEAPAPSDLVDDGAPVTITQADGDEPIRLEEPEPARSRRSEDDEGNSLRELFWGEE